MNFWIGPANCGKRTDKRAIWPWPSIFFHSPNNSQKALEQRKIGLSFDAGLIGGRGEVSLELTYFHTFSPAWLVSGTFPEFIKPQNVC
jgi:hypothetical protein